MQGLCLLTFCCKLTCKVSRILFSSPACLHVQAAQSFLMFTFAAVQNQMCVSDPAEHMEQTAVVIRAERSCCVHHEKCIRFFFKHILLFRGSSYLASQDSMMPFAPPCV